VTFSVRAARASDVPVLARHRCAMFRDMGKLIPDLQEPLHQATTAYLRDAMPRGEFLAWVAETAGEDTTIVGGAGVQLRPIMPRPREQTAGLELGPEALVLSVYVEPEWRRRGVANALMRALLDDLDARNVRRVVLHASPDGRRLYERLGFVSTNEMRLS
jgi:ribosomal protein S18 acetylase RimI-like enzyme